MSMIKKSSLQGINKQMHNTNEDVIYFITFLHRKVCTKGKRNVIYRKGFY